MGEHVIAQSLEKSTPPAEIIFDVTNHCARIAVIEKLKNKTGWLVLQQLNIDSFEREEYLLFSAFDEDGNNLDQETCRKLFNCAGWAKEQINPNLKTKERLDAEAQRHAQATISRSLETNNRHFNEARDQLDRWAEDMEIALQKDLDNTKRQIRDLQRQARQAPTLEEQRQLQEEISKLERKKRKMREKIFDLEDEISKKRDKLIQALEKRMQQKTEIKTLFTIKWNIV